MKIISGLPLMKYDIPEEMLPEAEKYRAELIEAVAEYDEGSIGEIF